MPTAHARNDAPVSTRRRSVVAVGGAIAGSVWTARAVVGAWTLQAALLASTLRGSIYDEAYHRAAIAYFAHGASPFDAQPEGLRGLGDVERYGSYLYHWLLSFPARWADGWSDDSRLVLLRLCSVAMVAGALLAVRRLATLLGLSGRGANLVVVLFAAVPMVTYLGITVNYDNLMLLLLVLMWVAAVRLVQADRVDLRLWAQFGLWAALLPLAKFSALPLVAVTGLAVLGRQVLVLRATGGLRGLRDTTRERSTRARVAGTVALVGAAVLALVAFVERYGVNLVRFGKPQPGCDEVQSLATCLSWGPWHRNYELGLAGLDQPASLPGLVNYVSRQWLPGMSTTFTYYGVLDSEGAHGTWGAHATAAVLLLAGAALLLVLVLGAAAALRVRGAGLLLASAGGYLVVLLWQNYADYRALGEAVGVQGRYLVPVLPVLLILGVRAGSHLVAANGRRAGLVRGGVVAALLLGLTQGPAGLGVLVVSDDDWLRGSAGDGVVRVLRDAAAWLTVDSALLPDPRLVVGTSAVP